MKMPIPDDWDGISFCRYAVCWPDSTLWKGILRGLITEPARGFFWDEYTGSINDTLASFRQTLNHNLDLKEVIMACDDNGLLEIAAALRSIAVSMQQQLTVQANCCSSGGAGSGGAGTTAPPLNPNDEGNPATDPPPDGFESWGQFFANKCAVATDIVTTLAADVNRMSNINIAITVVSGLLPVLIPILLTPVPFDDIVAIAGLIAILAGLGVSEMGNIHEILTDNLSDFTCALYNATSAGQAEADFEALFNQLWDDGGYPAVYGFAAKGVVAYMVGPSVVNRLFTLETGRTLPEGDCSGCVECGQTWEWESGEDQLAWEIADESNVSAVVISAIDPPCISVRATVTGSPGLFDWKTTEFDGPMLINPTSTLNSHSYLGSATTFYQYIRLAGSEGTKRYLSGSGTAIGDTPLDNDLSSWVGETIVEIGFECAWSVTADHDLTFYNVIWTCGEEA